MVVEVENFAFKVGGYGGCACELMGGCSRCRGAEYGLVGVRMRRHVIRFHRCRQRHLLPIDRMYCDFDRPSILRW